MKKEKETLEVKNRLEWKDWLSENHNRVSEIWLVYYRKETGYPSISYQDSLDEALCFGWVDSIIKKLDQTKYARKFTPRRDNSKWSLVNKRRVEKLMAEGLMTEHGLKKVEAARSSGSWENPGTRPGMDFQMPPEFSTALKEDPRAGETYYNLAATYQNQYLAWICLAKQPETRKKRISESIKLLMEGKKLGLR